MSHTPLSSSTSCTGTPHEILQKKNPWQMHEKFVREILRKLILKFPEKFILISSNFLMNSSSDSLNNLSGIFRDWPVFFSCLPPVINFKISWKMSLEKSYLEKGIIQENPSRVPHAISSRNFSVNLLINVSDN